MTQTTEEDFNEFSDEENGLFEHYRIEVDKGQSLMRIDKFLIDRIPNASRNKIQLAIDNGFVLVNTQKIKASYKVKPRDIISISLPQPPRDTTILPENIPLNIVFEDDDLLIVNKPAGMVVHPAHANYTGTLVNALVYHFQQLPTSQNGEGRPGLVHRIDKDTSGLLVIAKSELAMVHLAKQFYDHSIERTYIALIWGEPEQDAGTINVHLGRSFKDRRVVDAFPDGSIGRHAITHYQVLKRLRYVSVVKCNLETGRTHQIRAHFKYIGHPLFGDTTYGGDRVLKGTQFSKYKTFVENCFQMLPRQALHAKSLGFVHPRTGEFMQFDSELPQDLSAVIQKWEHYIDYND
ncbi:23S rRNA pseudouridine1911/1915/1917 synthase [Flexibacter flexilis DSM 6793]|uniref:Pseudouridine synthase n=2 Tax=Flexibacter flexilis TaxID=998 RepID=A0A1I1FM70_9BACT|nr:23S rRNA pseudouridine1911/1915/1917 synthase [Flexibacter flexilis DSM 6793]